MKKNYKRIDRKKEGKNQVKCIKIPSKRIRELRKSRWRIKEALAYCKIGASENNRETSHPKNFAWELLTWSWCNLLSRGYKMHSGWVIVFNRIKATYQSFPLGRVVCSQVVPWKVVHLLAIGSCLMIFMIDISSVKSWDFTLHFEIILNPIFWPFKVNGKYI